MYAGRGAHDGVVIERFQSFGQASAVDGLFATPSLLASPAAQLATMSARAIRAAQALNAVFTRERKAAGVAVAFALPALKSEATRSISAGRQSQFSRASMTA